MILRRILFSLACLSLIALVGVFAFSTFHKLSLEKIQFVTYPSDAKISVNGAPSVGQKTFYLEPGVYTVIFSRPGFSTELASVDTSIDGDYPILASLRSISDEAIAWEEENISQRQSFERLSSSLLSQQGTDKREEYPILNYLPSRNNLYSIGHISNDDGSITVTVHAPDVYVPYAINQIREWGLDPEDYDINFVNQGDVFGNE